MRRDDADELCTLADDLAKLCDAYRSGDCDIFTVREQVYRLTDLVATTTVVCDDCGGDFMLSESWSRNTPLCGGCFKKAFDTNG